MVLAMLGALGMALCLPKLPPRWAWGRGLLVSAIFIVAFVVRCVAVVVAVVVVVMASSP